MKNYDLYILSGREYGPIFIEMTSDLKARMKSHKAGHLSQSAFRIDQLVHIERFSTHKAAAARSAGYEDSAWGGDPHVGHPDRCRAPPSPLGGLLQIEAYHHI